MEERMQRDKEREKRIAIEKEKLLFQEKENERQFQLKMKELEMPDRTKPTTFAFRPYKSFCRYKMYQTSSCISRKT